MKKSIIAHFSEGGGQLKRKNHSTSEFAENYLTRKEAKRQRRIAINNEELRKKLNNNSLASMHLSVYASKIAFTLAEVLITLGIIGVVAALTLPTLIQNYKDKSTITQLKKFHSIISQAYQQITYDEGTPDTWELEDEIPPNSINLYNKFKPHLNIIKDCGINEVGCLSSKNYKNPSGSTESNLLGNYRYWITLNDGGSVGFYLYNKTVISGIESGTIKGSLGTYGVIYYDINGPKEPNEFGRDMFQFSIKKNKIIPAGSDAPDEIAEECLETGYYCSSWIMLNDNMDYTHCPDKIAAGKSSCKE